MTQTVNPFGFSLRTFCLLGAVFAVFFFVVTIGLGERGAEAQRRGGQAPVGQAVPRTQPPGAETASTTDIAAIDDALARGLNYLPGEVLVKFKAGIPEAWQNRALGVLRSRPTAAEQRRSGGGVLRVRDAAEPDAERLAALLRRQPEVEYAQPNYIRRVPVSAIAPRTMPIRVGATPSSVPNDPSFLELQWNFQLINAPGAWTINPGGKTDVIVAVLDTGLTTRSTTITRRLWTGQQFEQVPLRFEVHPDLPQSRVIFPRDFVFEPGGEPFDLQGHGTHVASTIAEEANNAIGLAGLAYNARVLPVKVCLSFWDLMLQRGELGIPGYIPSSTGFCTDNAISTGIRYAADSGASVINLSLGGPTASPAIRDAIVYAVSRGAFVAAAMGNAYASGNPVEYPAAYAPGIEGVMSVGAIGKSRTRAHYSGTGNHIEIVAPGGSSFDTDGGEDAGFVWQITLFPPDVSPLVVRPRFDRYVEAGYTGTSMATPHVSALAALLVSQGVTNPRAIEAVIRRTAVDLGPSGRDDEYGYGLIQARTALFGLGAAR